MDSPRITRPALALLVGVPLAWAVLLLFHPNGEGDQVYAEVQDQVTAWMAVHIGTLVFIPLMGGLIFLLLRGVDGTAARVSRIGAVLFVVFYGTWEALYGVGNGVLVSEVNGLPDSEQATGAALVQDFSENPLIRNFGVLAVIGTIGLIVATIAAGMALRREAGAPQSVAVLVGISGFLVTAHPPPFGPVGLLLFVAGVLLLARSQLAPKAAAPVGQPGPPKPA
jgi:hypothetical protein